MLPLFLNNRSMGVYYINETITTATGIRYEINERINSGGNAVVHKCVNVNSGDEFAIKFNLTTNKKRIARFTQEIDVLKNVQHEQLMQYIDDGHVLADRKKRKQEELFFLIMPLAESNLSDYLESQKVPYEEYIAQFKGLVAALNALHSKAIHRDIKPENILIRGETWFLSDFGLCKYLNAQQDLTRNDEPIGPRYWMSPEACNRLVGNDDEITIQSDIFQLCCIFWFVVTGRHPSGVLAYEDWNGPENIFEPIYQSLSHNPNQRPSNANQLLEMLETAAMSS